MEIKDWLLEHCTDPHIPGAVMEGEEGRGRLRGAAPERKQTVKVAFSFLR